MNITIIDYGMGNIKSLYNAINFLNYKVKVSRNQKEILKSDFVFLPGVGAFKEAIHNVNKYNLHDTLNEYIFDRKKNILGICLGMQLLCQKSKEHGNTYGLKAVNLDLEKFNKKQNFHIGFNQVIYDKDSLLFREIKQKEDFYFVHSYRAKPIKKPKIKVSYSNFGEKFISSFEYENIFGTQFHPEKSQYSGLKLLENFLKI